ncbi:MAG: hypothetical protein ACLUOI_33720 [Eisenbergiella sp.]
MRVTVETIDRQQEEQVLIRCHEVTDTVREIRHFILSRQESLEGMKPENNFRSLFRRFIMPRLWITVFLFIRKRRFMK